MLWPFTAWSLSVNRGLYVLVTMVVFLLAVPLKKNRLVFGLSVFLLLFSYPMVRHLIDGNLETLLVAGALVAVQALRRKSPALLAISLLLLTAKIQESWLLLIVLAIIVLRDWPRPYSIRSGRGVGLIVLPFMIWKGAD